MKKLLTLFLVFLMLISLVSCREEGDASDIPADNIFANETYTYNAYITSFPNSFSPFAAESEAENYILSLTQTGLYCYEKNDADGYLTVPALAETLPVDVTGEYALTGQYPIPSDAKEGYVYRIKLNEAAVWQDGTSINADTYIFSMQALLDGQYSGSKRFTEGELALVNAEEYQNRHMAGQPIYVDNTEDGQYVHPFEEWQKEADGSYTADGARLVFSLDSPLSSMNGYSIQEWHTESGGTDFAACLPVLRKLADENGFVPVNDTSINLIYSFIGSEAWGSQSKSELASYIYYANGFYESAAWQDVGLIKTGDYELLFVFKSYTDAQTVKSSLTRNFIVHPELYDRVGVDYGSSMDNYISCGAYKISTFVQGRMLMLEANPAWREFHPKDNEYQATTVSLMVMTDEQAAAEFAKGHLDILSVSAEDMGLYENSEKLVLTPEQYTTRLSFNGDINALKARESAGINKSILAYKDFRKALSLSIDRSSFCASLTACHQPAYGLISSAFVSNPETGTSYRDNSSASAALCSFYSVSNPDSINGYDREDAADLFELAYQRAKEDGNISDTDIVSLSLSVAEDNEGNRRIVEFLSEAVSAAVKGTSLENRVEIVLQEDSNYHESCRDGKTDMILSTWGGDTFSPESVLAYYCDNDVHYEYGFDAEQEMLTILVNGEIVTNSFNGWYESLVAGEFENAARSVRMQIIAELEKGIMSQYYTTPVYAHYTATLLSDKVSFGCEKYTVGLGFGGVKYLKFNYTDEEYSIK